MQCTCGITAMADIPCELHDWPKGLRLGQLSKEQQQAQFRKAIDQLKPEFARLGVAVVAEQDLN